MRYTLTTQAKARLGETELGLDARQGDVDDGLVEDDHQHPRAQHDERQRESRVEEAVFLGMQSSSSVQDWRPRPGGRLRGRCGHSSLFGSGPMRPAMVVDRSRGLVGGLAGQEVVGEPARDAAHLINPTAAAAACGSSGSTRIAMCRTYESLVLGVLE
jgi:hypothetical protein